MNTPRTTTGAVILAAGSASRYGALKQLIAIDGQPMVRHMARNALAAGLHPVVVVVGAEGDRVIDCLTNLDVHAVTNVEWATGMGGSLSTGVRALMDMGAPLRALMLLLADQVAIRIDELEGMLSAHATRPDRILACQHAGNMGPPCIFPLSYAGDLMDMNGAAGARVLLEKHAAHVDGIDLASAFRDIDTPEDYVAWQATRNERGAGELG